MVQRLDDRSVLAPVPLLSALIDGPIAARRDLTAGGARYRTYGFLAEGAAHAIDSLVAVRTVVFEQHAATMAELATRWRRTSPGATRCGGASRPPRNTATTTTRPTPSAGR